MLSKEAIGEEEKRIRRIDHSKIKDGEIILMDGVYDSNENYLRPIPHVEKSEEEIEKERLELEEKIKQLRKTDSSEFSEETENEEVKTKPLSVADILNMKFTEEPFLIEKLVPQKSLCVLSGYPESGKSWILLELARSVASDTPFLKQFQTQKGNVLFIDEETGMSEFQRRMNLLKFDSQLPIYFLSQKGLKVDNRENLEYLLEIVKKWEIKLVIFDPFVAIHSKRENEAQEMQKVMEALQEFIKKGSTVIFAHHHRKELGWNKSTPSQSLRGSSVLFGKVDSHVAIEKKSETKEEINLVITQEKLRRGKKITPFQVKLAEIEDQGLVMEYIGEYEEKREKIERAKGAIQEILSKESLTRKEVLERIKDIAGQRNSSEAFSALTESGKIQQVGKKEETKPSGRIQKVSIYALSLSEEINPEELVT